MLQFEREPDQRFKIFHELMYWKVNRILLVSSPYDAWILDKDQPLAERITHKYRGLNLTKPPRITRVPSAADALTKLAEEQYEMVVTMPRLADMDAYALGREIKKTRPEAQVVLLGHGPIPSGELYPEGQIPQGVDRVFFWTGNPDVLFAMIKSVEDRMNVARDTAIAGIRVILFVEDSPTHLSSILPILYRELIVQTQEVIDQGLNEEHRLLVMRTRPKILLGQTCQEALELYQKYEPYVLAVISDACFVRGCRQDPTAGIDLLNWINRDRSDIPLLLMSSDSNNGNKAKKAPISFVDKNSASLQSEIQAFLKHRVGFGDFVFVTAEGRQVARATNLKSLEEALGTIPEETLRHHCRSNDLSRWLFSHAETELAEKVRTLTDGEFQSWASARQRLVELIRTTRHGRHKSLVVNFNPNDFGDFTGFAKIGQGSMGGKARGLAFFSTVLHGSQQLGGKYPDVNIFIPQTLTITTEGFDELVDTSGVSHLAKVAPADEQIAAKFVEAQLPQWIEKQLSAYLERMTKPLAVRSSGLLEDARFRAYAGLYKTYLLPNDSDDFQCRVDQLIRAVKLVYASTYFQDPREFSRRVGNRTEDEKMAVIIQQVCGSRYNGFFYPVLSGVAQSINYYPFGDAKPEDGVAVIALGLGHTVVQGDRTVRFSPKNPQLALEISRLDELLANAQEEFFAIPMGRECLELGVQDVATLSKRFVFDARNEKAVKLVSSTYVPEENRISDSTEVQGYPVVTFAQILKYKLFPLGEIVSDLLAVGQESMGCPVEIEFAVNMPTEPNSRPEFCVLQIRPMAARVEVHAVDISLEETQRAFLVSNKSLGNCANQSMDDIVFVDPRTFELEATPRIAQEIGDINRVLQEEGRNYLLIGPGRWGSADRWLGIPIQWGDISAVGAIVETEFGDLRAEPSQGSHFFHNITTLGINYITVGKDSGDRIEWDYLQAQNVVNRTAYLRHIRLARPMTLKVDGRTGRCVAYVPHSARSGKG